MDRRSNSFDKKPGNHKPSRSNDKPRSFNKGATPFKKREDGDKPERPFRKFDDEKGKERRSFDKPGFKKREDGDRPARSYGNRDGFKKDFNFSDRPKRSFPDRDSRDGDRKPFEKREGFKKDFNSSDRPKRSFPDKDSRDGDKKPFEKREGFKKDFNSSDRPDRDKKPYGSRASSSGTGGKSTPYSGRLGAKAGTSEDTGRKPFQNSEGGKKPYGKTSSFKPNRKRSFEGDEDKKPFEKREDFKKDFSPSDRPKRSFDKDDKPKKPFVKKDEDAAEEKPKTAFKTPHKFKKAGGEVEEVIVNVPAEKPPHRKRKVLDEPDVELPTNQLMTLNKYIAHSGECSRREAGELVKQGKVKVNGELVMDPGYRVQETDQVSLLGKKLKPIRDLAYVLLNKPKGYITTTEDPQERATVMELVEGAGVERLYPVGRLDRNTSGLLLLTNDGDLAQKLSHPSYEIKKVYQVTLDKPITKSDFDKVVAGVELEDGIAHVDELAQLEDKNELGLEIHSGRNRIVRRIFEALGYQVEKLDRMMYAGLTKKNLPRGKWRFLDEREIVLLKHFKT